jgi:hypothetical protein
MTVLWALEEDSNDFYIRRKIRVARRDRSIELYVASAANMGEKGGVGDS